LLAQAYHDLGQVDQADRARAQAEATLRALVEGLPDPTLRASFLAASASVLHGRGVRA
jgi:hypothetical protein